MRMLVKIARSGELCYISHLDLLRLVQRTLRRAALPLKYSQGFNPHPMLSFAQALGVGLETVGDYYMVELFEPVPPREFVERFNERVPNGLCARKAREMTKDEKSPMAMVQAARYGLRTDGSKICALHEGVRKLMEMETCMCAIKDRQRDIRPLIYDAVYDETGATLTVSCGNQNLPHKTLVQAVCELADLCTQDISPRREDLLTRNESGAYVPLF